MRTRLAVAVLPLAALGLVAGPSHAEKKVEKTWLASAPIPDVAGLCDGTVPQSSHEEAFTAPAAGKLAVRLTGYPIDWDLFIRSDGGNIASVTSFNEKESLATVKLKKGQQVTIVSCNTAGGPTANGSYVFTY